MRVKLTKITLAAAIAASFALSTAFAANLPKNCTDEIVALSKGSGFSMSQFTSDLPVAVIKAKAQAKLPFGKPKDSEKTSIGMTFGCLKVFPESPGEILSLLKDVSVEMAKNMMGNNAKDMAGNDEKSSGQNSFKKEAIENADVIYLRNGQKVNATVTEMGIEEVKYKVGSRAALYVVKKSDISNISYSDGEKEFFCNGILYNFATHFCHADGQTYSCGNKPYDPAKQSCNNSNQVLNKCGKEPYDYQTHFCYNNNIFTKCGKEKYNPSTHYCDERFSDIYRK
jgi:molybdopterin-binding protein